MQKTNFKTRLLALLTAVFMVVMCVPFAAFAEPNVEKVDVVFYGNSPAEDQKFTVTKDNKITVPAWKGAAVAGQQVESWTANGTTVKVGDEIDLEKAAAINGGKAVGFGADWTAAPKRDLKVTFTVDKNLGTFTDPDGAVKVDFTIPEDSQDQYNIPTVEAVDGYKFVGWASEDGTVKWDANTKTFGVSSSWPDEVEIKAVFEKKESKKLNKIGRASCRERV